MFRQVREMARRVWRGAWKPAFRLPPEPKWYHYVDYWLRRPRDIMAGVLLFLMPPAAAFFIHEKYSSNPKGVLIFAAVVGVIWSLCAIVAYVAGKSED